MKRFVILLLVLISCVAHGQSRSYVLRRAGLIKSQGSTNWWDARSLESAEVYFRPGHGSGLVSAVNSYNAVLGGSSSVSNGIGFRIPGNNFDYISFNGALVNNDSYNYTVCMWVYTYSGGNYFVNWENTGDYSISAVNNSYRHRTLANGYQSFSYPSGISLNQWVFIAASVDVTAGSITLWVDGSSSTYTGKTFKTFSSRTMLGLDSTYTGWIVANCYIDEVAIFTNAISDTLIGEYYTNSYNADFSAR